MQTHDTQTEAKINLARRAIACPRWRWMPGMRDAGEATVLDVSDGGWLTTAVYVGDADGWSVGWRIAANAIPDLDDPATLGCLLALVREAWDAGPDIESYVTRAGAVQTRVSVWAAGDWEDNDPSDFVDATLAGALVAALEAAP